MRHDATIILVKAPTTWRQTRSLPPMNIGHGNIPKRPLLNPPQFTGTIFPGGIRDVYLRVLGTKDYLERTASDVNGYFEFKGTYYELVQYEFCIFDSDGTEAKIFKIDYPAYLRWVGNTTMPENISSGYTRV